MTRAACDLRLRPSGRLLERWSDSAPRGMIVARRSSLRCDRIRLTGSPALFLFAHPIAALRLSTRALNFHKFQGFGVEVVVLVFGAGVVDEGDAQCLEVVAFARSYCTDPGLDLCLGGRFGSFDHHFFVDM